MRTKSRFIVTVPSGFETEARREIERLVSGAEVKTLFFKGTLLVETSRDTYEIVRQLREAKTLYVGRVFPVDSKLTISPQKASITELYKRVLSLGKLGSGDTFLVRCRRRGSHDFSSQDVEREAGSLLEQAVSATVDLKNPTKIVTVQIFQNLAFVGVTDAPEVLAKSIGVSRKYRKGERPFTRAEHKIKEAIEAFNLEIKPDFEVLDLGSAPGGWTKVLASLAGKVVSVDPAALEPAVAALPNVRHLKCKAEEVPSNVGQFHLLTNDMNLNPLESAPIMVDLADRLRKDSIALMTVKFITRNRRKHINEAIETLKTRYSDFRVRKLPHNRYETTLFMRKI